MSDAGAALFLDRDGTLIEHVPYLRDPDQVRLLPGVRDALAAAAEAGFQLYLHTNQSGVARGYFGIEAVEACNLRMLELLDMPAPFRAIQIAVEPPGDETGYRKPSPRFILESIERDGLVPKRCFMVGDHKSDMEAARNAGIVGIAICQGAGAKELPDWNDYLTTAGVPAFDTLSQAVEFARAASGI